MLLIHVRSHTRLVRSQTLFVDEDSRSSNAVNQPGIKLLVLGGYMDVTMGASRLRVKASYREPC